jgi:hypothetical protein
MINNKRIIIVATIGIATALSSCKKYLDVNKNPNVLQSTTVATLLPTSEVYLSSVMGVDLEVNGSIWAQYWTQIPSAQQYKLLDEYEPTSQTYETPWDNIYSGAGENLYQMDQLAFAQNKKQYRAISFLLRAYMFQVITDAWGDAPFTQALQALPPNSITSPKYDAQQVIYNGILAYIDSANALIDPSDPSAPGGDDLIYGGNMAEWQKFSNTLQLKVLMRLSQKNPSQAQAGIAALYASGAAFIGTGDDALINFTSASGNKNPLYSEEVGVNSTQNFAASATCLDSMMSNGDPRMFIFYEPVDTNNDFVGLPQGVQTTSLTPSIPSYNVAGDAQNTASATAPVRFLSSYESYFLQAEAAARGWGTGSDATLFTEGITASFSAYSTQLAAAGVNATTALSTYLASANWAQYPATGTVAQKVRYIITQKWFSMCGNQGFEAWTEWRRTGYPDFFTVSLSAQNGGVFPRRFLYPSSELTRNINFPGLVSLTTPVWWDTH